MRVDQASAEDIEHVALHMRERDYREFAALSFVEGRERMAQELVNRYAGRDGVLCGSKDGPIWVGMSMVTRPGVMTLGLFATDRFPAVGLATTRFVCNLLDRYEESGIHRIEAVSMEGYRMAHRWLRTIGLQRETEPMRGYGRNGEAFIQFARVKDAGAIGE